MDIRFIGRKVRDFLALIGGVCVLFLLFTGARALQDLRPRQSYSLESSDYPVDRAGEILLTESGTGTGIFSLVVPESCTGQDLNYVATRIVPRQQTTIKFVVMQGNDEVRVTGPKDVERTGDTRGVGVWSLEDDRHYTLNVYGENADWMLLVKCR